MSDDMMTNRDMGDETPEETFVGFSDGFDQIEALLGIFDEAVAEPLSDQGDLDARIERLNARFRTTGGGLAD